jgi:hypothetical protein
VDLLLAAWVVEEGHPLDMGDHPPVVLTLTTMGPDQVPLFQVDMAWDAVAEEAIALQEAHHRHREEAVIGTVEEVAEIGMLAVVLVVERIDTMTENAVVQGLAVPRDATTVVATATAGDAIRMLASSPPTRLLLLASSLQRHFPRKTTPGRHLPR